MLPRWMKQAIKDQVVTESEAKEIHRLAKESTEEYVILPEHLLGDILRNLRDPIILKLYCIAFLLLGSFMAVYNYIAYPLLAPPYNLSQTAVGMTRVLRLVGVSSSAKAGMSLPRLAVMRPMLRESMSVGKSTVSVRVPLR